MTYELFEQGPSVYLPIIIFSLIITLISYGAFPLIFAFVRKKEITKKDITCFVMWLIFLL